MKYKRLRITNYRGVDSLEIKFESRGLTLVQGPNEAGKTSLNEAIGILFEHPDNASNKHVKPIRPVHRDVGPEIELDAESGPYKFTYFKRFHKNPETKLTISNPTPENHTGREAHDRAKEILGETLDVDLWKALMIRQGDAIAQPDLANQQSLSAALDKAAGGVPTDQAEEGLFVKSTEEYRRFYSERTGKENKSLKEATEKQDKAESKVDELVKKLRVLDQDIESAARLQSELPDLKRREAETKKELDAQATSLRDIEKLESRVAEAKLKLESSSKTEEMAARNVKERKELVELVDRSDKEYQELLKSTTDSVTTAERAEKEFASSETAFQQADQARKSVDSLAAIRRTDFDYYNDRLFLDQLGERKQRIDAARKAAAIAEQFAEKAKIDQTSLDKIVRTERDLLTVNAKLETAAPSVKLRGLGQCKIEIDGDEVKIEKDESRELSVADRVTIAVEDRLEVQIVAGSSTDELTREVEDARQALDDACRLAGVDSPDLARSALDERHEAERKIEEKERIEGENLRDLSYDELAEKLLRLEQTVPDYLAKRATEPLIASDLDTARTAWDDAEEAQEQAQAEWNDAQEAVNVARNIRDELNNANESERVQLRSQERNLEQQRSRLDAARKSVTEELLKETARDAERTVDSEEQKVEEAESSLSAKNPEKIKALTETARDTLETIRDRRNAAQTELTEVRTRLKIHGEEGLHEKLQSAKTKSETIVSTNQSLFRRAAAAKLLNEIMCQERDKARQAYVAPLKDRVERLGRLVFDESFQVEIDENLQITARTSGGVRVPFESLSGGTKEQLSLMFRLACSIIVADEGGMPLIMDDALGYTDPERLRLMGAVLAKAAKECQIVIFTCVPDRYGNIGSAAVVSL